ncbi:MAG: DNA-directed RNA polymerase subunit D [Candidatus Diapherotrites archaeon]|nr:DNA-directed RNA polymerase subunit D [Candidatus Diapherotrites archaeon]
MAISVKKIDEKNNVSRFLVKGVSPAFINAIRRSVMLHVPCLAIENVSIYENDTVMFDEFLAHRLGMLPVKTDLKGYKRGDKVKMVLEKEGPCVVYSKDIKSTDPKIEIMDKNIPLVKLAKGQRIKIEMDAVMESGREHSKWQPGVVSFQEMPAISVEGCNLCGECAKACPKGILEIKAKKVVLSQPFECILCGACRDACEKEALCIEPDKNAFILAIEPIAGLTAKEIMESALNEMLEKSEQLQKALQKID